MEILSPKFPGRLLICSSCGAVLVYNEHDIYGSDVYCPLCKQPTKIDYDKDYNGVIEENGNDSQNIE